MPLFRVRYCDKQGRSSSGDFVAASPAALYEQLSKSSLFPEKVKQIDASSGDRRFTLKKRVLISILRQIEIQVGASVPVLEAVKRLKDTHTTRKGRHYLSSIYTSLASSTCSFSQALAEFPLVMPPVLLAIIASGEGSGDVALAQRLRVVREWLEYYGRTKYTIIVALISPLFLILATAGYMVILVGWYMPKMEELLDASKVAVPTPTKILMDVCHLLSSNWIAVMLLLGVIGFGAGYIFGRLSTRTKLASFAVRMPILGPVIQAAFATAFAKNLHPMISAGTTPIAAVEASTRISSDGVFRCEFVRMLKLMKNGASLGAAFSECPYLPPELASVISTAENSGNLVRILDEMGKEYEMDLKRRTDLLLKVVNPLVFMAVAAVIGTILIISVLPLSAISNSF